MQLVKTGIRTLSAESASPNASASTAKFQTLMAGGDALETAGREITSRTTEVNGIQMHYETTGHGKHLVLLIPGALGCSRTDWVPQLENLNKGLCTTVAMDPRGYGLSRPPDRDWPDHFFERDADDAAKLMQIISEEKKNLKVDRFSVVGWSDGGTIGMILAAKYPDLVQKLVVFGANAIVTEEDVEIFKSVRDINKWSERMRKPMVDMYGEEYFQKTHSEWVDNYIKVYYEDRKGDICSKDLPNIKCPTLLIHGLKDYMCPVKHADFIEKNIPDVRRHDVPDGKHNLHMKHFKLFNSLVETFIIQHKI